MLGAGHEEPKYPMRAAVVDGLDQPYSDHLRPVSGTRETPPLSARSFGRASSYASNGESDDSDGELPSAGPIDSPPQAGPSGRAVWRDGQWFNVLDEVRRRQFDRADSAAISPARLLERDGLAAASVAQGAAQEPVADRARPRPVVRLARRRPRQRVGRHHRRQPVRAAAAARLGLEDTAATLQRAPRLLADAHPARLRPRRVRARGHRWAADADVRVGQATAIATEAPGGGQWWRRVVRIGGLDQQRGRCAVAAIGRSAASADERRRHAAMSRRSRRCASASCRAMGLSVSLRRSARALSLSSCLCRRRRRTASLARGARAAT